MSLPCSCLFLLLLAPAADEKKPSPYPRADLLIEANELAKEEAATKLRILDARGKSKYIEGHIPGSDWVDVVTWSKAFVSDPDPEAWGGRLGGVRLHDAGQRVVVLADDMRDAARVWWILRYWGIKDVRLLNGGWPAYQAAGGEVTKAPSPLPTRRAFKPAPLPERHATKEFMLEAVKSKTHQILDVRSRAEYCGEAESAKRNGAMPGAVHLEWSEVLDPKTHRFKAPEDLTKLFKDAGLDPNRPAATYCQSGGRAAVMAFTLELMGGRDVRNYYRSWSEWGNATDTPIVKPKK